MHRFFFIPKPTQRGFSLIELLIYMALLSGISVILVNSYVSLTKGRGQSEARSEVSTNLRFALDRMSGDVKSATVLFSPVFSIATTTLNLGVGTTTVIYDVVGGRLRRTQAPLAAEFVTSTKVTIDALLFTRVENYNAPLAGTTTQLRTTLTMRYNSSSTDWAFVDSVQSTTALR